MRKLSIVGIIVAFILLGVFVWWRNGLSAVDPNDTSEQVFVIPKSMPVRAIVNELKEQNFIKDPVVFFIYIKLHNLDRAIQAGSYKLTRSMSLPELIEEISHGTVDVWITIPEGYRAEEIAEVLEAEIPSYEDSWVSSLKAEEGYLFPDTYLIPKDADISTVISIFKKNFNAKVESIGLSADASNIHELVTIASLIEREALRDDEKPLIASVIYNRLNNGMALDIDATLQYAKGKVGGKWWTVPTGVDRQIDSKYNTYKYPGLPPGPIANPGIEAIRAANSPTSSEYYFYIHDREGNIHFSRTLTEHNQKVDQYLN